MKRSLFDSSSNEDLDQKSLQFEGIKLSLTKLKKKFILPQIKQLFQIFKNIKNYIGIRHISILNNIPYEALSCVEQFTGKQYRFQYICFGNNVPFHKRIIKSPSQISHINLPNLQALRITNLMIDNIESLTWILTPNLRCLQMYGNKINNLNVLAKANFPKLQIITFYHNPIMQIEKFCRFHSKKLTGYEFDNKQTYDHKVEDYRFLFKMQNSQLKMLKVQDQKRIDLRQRPAFKILNQPGTKILYYEHQIDHVGYLSDDDFDYSSVD